VVFFANLQADIDRQTSYHWFERLSRAVKGGLKQGREVMAKAGDRLRNAIGDSGPAGSAHESTRTNQRQVVEQ
jgi:hypothetical protein